MPRCPLDAAQSRDTLVSCVSQRVESERFELRAAADYREANPILDVASCLRIPLWAIAS